MEQTYIATAEGYYNGTLIKEGEIFPADFRAIVRDEQAKPIIAGKRDNNGNFITQPIYPIKYDEKGNPVRGKLLIPSWAEPADGERVPTDEYVAPSPTLDAVRDEVIKTLLAEGWAPKDGGVKASAPAQTEGNGDDDGKDGGAEANPLPAGVTRMKRDELIDLAAERGVDLGADVDSLKRDEIAAIIMAAPNPA